MRQNSDQVRGHRLGIAAYLTSHPTSRILHSHLTAPHLTYCILHITAKAARDGETSKPGEIPDGFYLVADSTNPQAAWHKAMIEAVATVTHIAPADANGNIIDEPVIQRGVIGVPSPRSIGLCAGMTDAPYATTTEVYPDSPKASDEQCNRAQVTCISAALDHIIAVELSKPEL